MTISPSPEGLWTAIGGVVDQTRVTLSLSGADLDPSDLTASMGAKPTSAYRKGDSISAGSDETRPAGFWSLELNVNAPEDAESALASLFAMLPAGDEFWAGLQARYRISLNLMMVVKAWNRGFALSPITVQELARRGLSLSFEVYAEPQQMASACFA